MIRIITIVFVLNTLWLGLHIKNSQPKENITGEEIVKLSRKSIGLEKVDLKSVKYKIKTSTISKKQSSNTVPDFFLELSLNLPDKIQAISSFGEPLNVISTKTWNGDKYKSFVEANIMGRRIIKDDTNDDRNLDSKKTLSNIQGKIGKGKLSVMNAKRKPPKEIILQSMWTELFPLILIHPFEQDVKFRYVGKAKVKNITANVVDFNPKNGKNYRLLFDAETNYLLRMIVTFKRNDELFVGDVEENYYFSERELLGGVLIPNSIKVEKRLTAKGEQSKLSYLSLEILEFKYNPKLKESMFEIK